MRFFIHAYWCANCSQFIKPLLNLAENILDSMTEDEFIKHCKDYCNLPN